MKSLCKYMLVFAAMIVAYLLFGAGAYLMPDGAVQHNVRKTLENGDLSSDQPRAILPNRLPFSEKLEKLKLKYGKREI